MLFEIGFRMQHRTGFEQRDVDAQVRQTLVTVPPPAPDPIITTSATGALRVIWNMTDYRLAM